MNSKQLRAIGHKLKPVVTVGSNGLSESVVAEIDAALERHELVKIKVAAGDRARKRAIIDELCERTGARLVQSVGNIVLVLRRTPTPDPNLSNLVRPL